MYDGVGKVYCDDLEGVIVSDRLITVSQTAINTAIRAKPGYSAGMHVCLALFHCDIPSLTEKLYADIIVNQKIITTLFKRITHILRCKLTKQPTSTLHLVKNNVFWLFKYDQYQHIRRVIATRGTNAIGTLDNFEQTHALYRRYSSQLLFKHSSEYDGNVKTNRGFWVSYCICCVYT